MRRRETSELKDVDPLMEDEDDNFLPFPPRGSFQTDDTDFDDSKWTFEEEDALITSYTSFGTNWSKITSSMPGRTENTIKEHLQDILHRVDECWTNPIDSKLISLKTKYMDNRETTVCYFPARKLHLLRIRWRMITQPLTFAIKYQVHTTNDLDLMMNTQEMSTFDCETKGK